MQATVIDRHAGCLYEFGGDGYVAVCDCGWLSDACHDCGEASDQWRWHRQHPEPLGNTFRVVTSADSRNKRELQRVWVVEAEDEDEAASVAREAHAPRVGYRGVYVKSVERVA